MSWALFAVAYCLAIITLFAPGYIALRCLNFERIEAFCVSPAISVVILSLLGVLYKGIGLFTNWWNLVLAPCAVLIVLLSIKSVRVRSVVQAKRNSAAISDWCPVVLYIACGVIFTVLFFVGNIDGASSFQPDNDNAFHLGVIRTFADTGGYSIFDVNVYPQVDVSPSVSAGSFYPAAFHVIAASLFSVLPGSVAIAENALAAAVISSVFPLGCYWFFAHLFREEPLGVYIGAFTCMLITAFPWCFITWGPLFPNLLGLCLVPTALGCLMAIFNSWSRFHAFPVRQCLLLFIVVCGLSISHPNALFSFAIFAILFLASSILFFSRHEEGQMHLPSHFTIRLIVSIGFVAGCGLLWILVSTLPFMQGVVTFPWPAYEPSIAKGLFDAFSLSLTGQYAQPVLAVALIAGIIFGLRQFRSYGWIAIAFLVCSAQFAVGSSSVGFFRSVASGFWYNDWNRVAANVALTAMPLCALGIAKFASLLLSFLHKRESSKVILNSLAYASLAAITAFIFASHALLPAHLFQLPTDSSERWTSILQFKYGAYSHPGYEHDEQAFVDEALRSVPEGSLILNVPNDGSCFAYALQDANVYYKNVTLGYANLEQTEDSFLVRTSLDRIVDDRRVQDAVSDLGAQYVLLLDQGLTSMDDHRALPVYDPAQWQGLISITDNTPGFKVVLANGDMRLYEIETDCFQNTN